jgi:2-methylisocitrate lyase-like PEP mutase family enzyme
MTLAQSELAARADQLRRLHDGYLVLPNAWDAGSARALAALGFAAIATTSSGVSDSLGYADRQITPIDEMFAAVGRISRAVDVPVTADVEAGYGLPADELVDRLIRAGAVGLNIEDTDHPAGSRTLVDADPHAGYLRAIKEAGRARGVDVFLNARVDVHLRQFGEAERRLDEALRRARMYLDAGADSIYPIFVNDEASLRPLVGLGAPVNVLYMPNGPSLDHLRSLGVRRVTFGGHLQEVAMKSLEGYLRASGALGYTDGG